MKRTHRALSAALAVVLASSLCTIPAYAVESDAEPPSRTGPGDETAPNQSPEADHGPGNEVPDASGTAEASGSKSQTRTENATEPTASPLQAENASRSAVAPPAGELRVTLTEGRPAATAGTAYEVALADSDGVQVGAQQLNLSLEGDSWSVARFDGLADGSYTLSVRAPGIAPYSQKIDVKGDSSAVELYVGDLAADPQAPARIGVLVPGDVNGDGTVDDADASAIIDDIEAGAASPACDANGDGTVSLADLETAVSSFDRVAVEATVARSLPPAAVEAAEGSNIQIGAQNVHFAESGAYTGEVSADMLSEVGVKYVIVGHSERRQYFGETDETVNMRAKAAISKGITPIICVGESLTEREQGVTDDIVRRQTKIAFLGISAEQAESAVIAYEPVWAIGTGKTATAEQADEVCGIIRETIKELYGSSVSDKIRIQYGGSMNAKNAAELLSKPNIDGGLIGGASLKAEDFSVIVGAAK